MQYDFVNINFIFVTCLNNVVIILNLKFCVFQNISGTLTAVLNIISIASTPDPRTSAIYYFIAAIFVLLVAFDTYFALPLIVSIFRFCTNSFLVEKNF